MTMNIYNTHTYKAQKLIYRYKVKLLIFYICIINFIYNDVLNTCLCTIIPFLLSRDYTRTLLIAGCTNLLITGPVLPKGNIPPPPLHLSTPDPPIWIVHMVDVRKLGCSKISLSICAYTSIREKYPQGTWNVICFTQ